MMWSRPPAQKAFAGVTACGSDRLCSVGAHVTIINRNAMTSLRKRTCRLNLLGESQLPYRNREGAAGIQIKWVAPLSAFGGRYGLEKNLQ